MPLSPCNGPLNWDTWLSNSRSYSLQTRRAIKGLVFMFSAHPSYQPFEFMASGCVTITNDNPRNRWLLKDGENAILVEPTVSCVASKIIQVLENPELRARVAAGGLATVSSLNWPDALEKIYRYVRNPHLTRESYISDGKA